MNKLYIPCLFASFLVLTPLHGAVVELLNGDRISGEIISRDAEFLHIKSPIVGTLALPVSSLKSIDKQEVAATPPPPPPPPPAPAPAPVPFDSRLLPDMNGLRSATAAFLNYMNVWDEWKSNLSLSLSLLTGQTNSRNTNVAFNSERKWTKSSLRFEVTQEYEVTETNGVDNVTRNRFKALARYRHDISKLMFFQSDSQYMFARVKGIDHDIRQSAGIGWRLYQSDRLSINTTSSITAQYTVLDGDAQDVSCAPTLFEEIVYKWTDTVNVRQEASAMFPVTGDADPSYHFAAVFQNKFMENLSMNLEYVYDYDGAVGVGAKASQHSFRIGLGMSF